MGGVDDPTSVHGSGLHAELEGAVMSITPNSAELALVHLTKQVGDMAPDRWLFETLVKAAMTSAHEVRAPWTRTAARARARSQRAH
eukprot:5447676-Prymnesium_polylepis.1